jgi:hypothetical protein
MSKRRKPSSADKARAALVARGPDLPGDHLAETARPAGRIWVDGMWMAYWTQDGMPVAGVRRSERQGHAQK